MKETHLIGQLLGYDFGDSPHVKPLLDDPLQLRAQALAALETYFRALAEHDPLAVVLEDVHWADDSSLDAFGHLLSKLEQMPLLVLCAGRSSLYQRRPHWGEGLTYHRRLDLQPLSKRAVGQLLEEILQRVGEVPAKLRELVVAGADGNPFYVEELVKMLIEDGVIVPDADGRSSWRIETERLATVQVPPSLTSLLQARVDRLPSEERKALQQASVVGRLFWDRAVAHIQQNSGEESHDISDTLSALRAREMVFRREATAFADSHEYLFKHALLRDVAYESVLKRLRWVYHGLVADWLIEQVGERIGEFVGIIADHLEGAGRSDEAVGYLLRAGDQARIVHAHAEAVQRYQHALALLETKGDYDQAARVCMRLGITHQNAYDFGKAREAFDKGFALWQQAGEIAQFAPLPPAPHALRIDWGEPMTLDPTLFHDSNSDTVIGHLFSGLVEPGPDFGVAPNVARNWQVSEDGRTYVFHLRDDVNWSDGTLVTADDFAFAWRRRLDPVRISTTAAMLYDIKNARAYHQGELVDAGCLGVQAGDDNTLVVELEEPAGYFLQLLAHASTCPVPRHVVEAYGASWTEAKNIVTNGPFLLKAWLPGQSMVLVRNPHYHGRFGGNATQVDLVHLSDWSAKLAMYEADELDILSLSSMDTAGELDWVRVQQRHPDQHVTIPEWTCSYMGVNASKQPLDDPRVRRALILATDREAFTNAFLHGRDVLASGGFVPPGMPGHSPGIGLPYDPAQARQLLVEAGYPNGRDFPALEVFCYEHISGQVDFLGKQWRDNLGIEITAVVLDVRSYLEKLHSSSPPDLFLYGWYADYPDPDNFLRVGLEHTRRWWHNETFERQVRQARRLTDQRERIDLYRRADRILVQEAAIMPLYYGRRHELRKPWLSAPFRDRSAHSKDIIIQSH